MGGKSSGGDLRPFRFDLLREGDTFFSRSDTVTADVITYAEAWSKSREGRRAARAAVKNPSYPNHAGSVHCAWGQKYPVEASPSGYVRGDFDDYREPDCRIVGVYRWRGFDSVAAAELCGQILERWARKATSPKYDWVGAIVSSPLGRWVFPRKAKERVGRLFCSEGVVYLHAMCGLVGGRTFAADTPLATVDAWIDANPSHFPRSKNPVDVMMWMMGHPEFVRIDGVYPA